VCINTLKKKRDIKALEIQKPEDILSIMIQECTDNIMGNKVCYFSIQDYIYLCRCWGKSNDYLKNMALISLYELCNKGIKILLSGITPHMIMREQVGEVITERKSSRSKGMDVYVEKSLYLTVRYTEEYTYLFEFEENIKTSYLSSEDGRKLKEEENIINYISIFEISHLWMEHDVYSNQNRYMFKDIKYYQGNKGINEREISLISIDDIVNYISSDAIKIIKKSKYGIDISSSKGKDINIFHKIINIVRLLCWWNRRDKTSVYGIIDKDKQYLPGRYDLIMRYGEDPEDKDIRVREFEAMFIEEIDIDKTSYIAENLMRYVEKDYVSKIVLQYGIASIFRYYLLNTKKIDLFPNLILIGEKGSGKSARINLLYNQLLLGTEEYYTKDYLKGSGIRLQNEGWITMPMFIDELSEIPKSQYDILKSIATSPKAKITKYTTHQKKITYTILRPLIIATNKLVITDEAFEDRCIIIPVNKEDSINFEKIEKTYIGLRYSIKELGKVLYHTIDRMIEIIENMDIKSRRDTAKSEVIRIGGELVKRIFQEVFGIDYEPVELKSNEESCIVSSKDLIEEYIISKVRNIVKEICGLNLTEFMDMGDRDNDKTGEFDHIKRAQGKLEKIGLYIRYGEECKHYIGISKEGLKYLELKSKFNINSLRQLATELNTKRTTIYYYGNRPQVVKIYLD